MARLLQCSVVSAAASTPRRPTLAPTSLERYKKTFGPEAILELCAQLVWCELYDMKHSPQKKQKNIYRASSLANACPLTDRDINIDLDLSIYLGLCLYPYLYLYL